MFFQKFLQRRKTKTFSWSFAISSGISVAVGVGRALRSCSQASKASTSLIPGLTMKRYIDNPYPDYQNGETVKIPQDYVKSLIKDYVDEIILNTESEDDGRGDLYVGNGGIAFMFWKMSKSPAVASMFPALKLAEKYISTAKNNAKHYRKRSDENVAFLLGNAGIYAVAAAISFESRNTSSLNDDLEKFLVGYDTCKNIDFARHGGDEVLVGRAGYLSGCYWLNKNLGSETISEGIISKLCEAIIESGRQYSLKHKSPLPLMFQYHGTEYLGAAHGASAIFHMLLENPDFKSNKLSKSDYDDIRRSVDFYVSLQDKEGNFPTALEDITTGREKRLIHWCHGAPGALFLLIKSYLIFKDKKYLESAELASEVIWKKGLLLKGPGICHGVAGNGYSFLILYRLTNNPKYLYRASKFMEFLTHPQFKSKARTPDRPYSLYEGTAGTVCFLVDLLNPDQAEFPFMDVF